MESIYSMIAYAAMARGLYYGVIVRLQHRPTPRRYAGKAALSFTRRIVWQQGVVGPLDEGFPERVGYLGP